MAKVKPIGQVFLEEGESLRPIYESAQDKKREREFANDIERFFNVRMVEFGQYSIADYVICRERKGNISGGSAKDQATSLAEIKCRNIRADEYGSLMISYKKIEKAILIGRHLGLKVSVFWRCIDADYFYVFNTKEPEVLEVIMRSGRVKNTRDKWDVEPCIYVPVEKCRKIGEKK